MIAQITRCLNALKNTKLLAWLLLVVLIYSINGSLAVQIARANRVDTAKAITAVPAARQAAKGEKPAQKQIKTVVASPKKLIDVPAAKRCSPQGIPSTAGLNAGNMGSGYHETKPDVKYYEVYGNTSTEIYDQVMACGPLFANGARYAAATAYNFSWSFDAQPTAPGSCGLTAVKVTVASEIIMPKWQPTDRATNFAVNYWTTARQHLLAHELGHASIAAKAARGLYDKLTKLQPSQSCAAVRARANQLGSQAKAAVYQAQVAYDKSTNHGTNH